MENINKKEETKTMRRTGEVEFAKESYECFKKNIRNYRILILMDAISALTSVIAGLMTIIMTPLAIIIILLHGRGGVAMIAKGKEFAEDEGVTILECIWSIIESPIYEPIMYIREIIINIRNIKYCKDEVHGIAEDYPEVLGE